MIKKRLDWILSQPIQQLPKDHVSDKSPLVKKMEFLKSSIEKRMTKPDTHTDSQSKELKDRRDYSFTISESGVKDYVEKMNRERSATDATISDYLDDEDDTNSEKRYFFL